MSEEKARLILEDGTEFVGTGFGADRTVIAELVFNTSMVGYQEILSDPSYTDQAVVMTYPLIGNYGINDGDFETRTPTISAFVVREYNDKPSNFRSTRTLDQVMKQYGTAGISGVDTRKITRHIRTYGSCRAMITREAEKELPTETAVKLLQTKELPRDGVSRVSTKKAVTMGDRAAMVSTKKAVTLGDWAAMVSTKKIETMGDRAAAKYHVVVIDCGVKWNILRMLEKKGCLLTVVPWNTTAQAILDRKPDGVFLSNGPGDPADVQETIQTVKELRGRVPIFGICLGHQILSLAYGAKTYKLKFGHRGGNHSVKNLLTDKIEMTSQNHSYAVDTESIRGTGLEITHKNLLDDTVEGVRCRADFAASVQYHPESAPGPQDSVYLFDVFLQMMAKWREEKQDA